ncbi:hypothetical protein [Litorisediminicola beolgyonensis]|uniref:Phosphotransferase enzyme family protein n=1 Tax=Litorisediminicola beolgyonensis TaxID=1173614 RepID=A0ABW3ZID8_9RHOB
MSKRSDRLAAITATAEAHFGAPVIRVDTPGGEGRSSCRLHFPDRSVIATHRPNFRRAHLEAYVLHRLAPICDVVPECLGIVGETIFQSDLGDRRLNQEIARVSRTRRRALAEEAVIGIHRIHAAARQIGLETEMPHLGVTAEWIDNLGTACAALAPYSEARHQGVDLAALTEALAVAPRQFVKWDCRSGNAALGPDDRLRWFDFEYAGVRHGAEDFAWLLGDEAWPLSPADMDEILQDSFDPTCGHDRDDWFDYLAIYTTLHCVQRFKLIVKEAAARGWLSKSRVRKYDDAGVHPEFAAHLCRAGAHFAARHPLTQAIGRDFEDAERVFNRIIADAA